MLTAVASGARPDVGVALERRFAGFGGFLRANGFDVGGGDAARVVGTLGRIGALEPDAVRWSLKALLCRRAAEWRRFDALFDAYFLPPNTRVFAEGQRPIATHDGDAASNTESRDARRSRDADRDARAEARFAASREESLEGTDFEALRDADDIRDLEALMRRFARRLRQLELRRTAQSARGRRLDLPGTIRRSVERGGVPLSLAWRERRRMRPRLVLLLDVSRSMSAYSFFFLRLARALSSELADVHSFVFHTRITGVSEALRDADPWRAQEKLHLLAAGWGGGTRIGECVADFNRDHAPRLVHSRTALVIVSDGYDTGEPETLAHALSALRRRARRVVWINPLAARPGWSPASRGMQAALPHVDMLAPGADLASLERALPDILASLR